MNKEQILTLIKEAGAAGRPIPTANRLVPMVDTAPLRAAERAVKALSRPSAMRRTRPDWCPIRAWSGHAKAAGAAAEAQANADAAHTARAAAYAAVRERDGSVWNDAVCRATDAAVGTTAGRLREAGRTADASWRRLVETHSPAGKAVATAAKTIAKGAVRRGREVVRVEKILAAVEVQAAYSKARASWEAANPGEARDQQWKTVSTAARAEIERRGHEVEITGKYGGVRVTVVAEAGPAGPYLLKAEGWRHYSVRFGAKWASLAYLYGTDDAGPWAARVPGTMSSAAEALAWLEPAAVKAARVSGRTVLRQGDVYVVQTGDRKDRMTVGRLPTGHAWDAARRVLRHGAHEAVEVPFPARVYVQSTLTPRSARRRTRRGD